MRNLASIIGDGRKSAASDVFEVRSPATDDVVAHCEAADLNDVAASMAAASAAFDVWRKRSPEERAAALLLIADGLLRSAGALARIIHEEQGKPLAEAEGEAQFIAEEFRMAARETQMLFGRVLAPPDPFTERRVERAPLGVIAVFPSSNYPAAIAARKLAAALAAGCTVVMRAPEEAPGAAFHIAEKCRRSPLPNGAVCCLAGNPEIVTAAMIKDPRCAGVSFTGSARIGRLVLSHAAAAIKPSVVELGGAAPAIICADADIEAAATSIAVKKLENAGQNCAAPNCVLVDRRIHHAFVDTLWDRFRDAALDGEGRIAIGPLISKAAADDYSKRLLDFGAQGATIRRVEARLPEKGNFVCPALATGVGPASALIHEEIFGPLLPIAQTSSLDEALAIANSSPLGLVGYGFSASARNARRIAEELEVGSVAINKTGVGDIDAPFGGLRGSGFGTEGGGFGLEAFLTWRFVSHRHISPSSDATAD